MTDRQYTRIIELFDALVECDYDQPYLSVSPSPAEKRILKKLIQRGWVEKLGHMYRRTPDGERVLEWFL